MKFKNNNIFVYCNRPEASSGQKKLVNILKGVPKQGTVPHDALSRRVLLYVIHVQ